MPADQVNEPTSDGSAEAPESIGEAAGRRPRRRRRRWVRILLWSLASLLFLLILLIVLIFWALANLEHPWIAGWVKDKVAEQTGIGIDYRKLSVAPFSGIEGADLVVFTPEPYARHAAELLHLDRLDVDWDFWPLVSGAPDIERISLRGLTLTVVVDESGRTSLDALGGSGDSATSEEPEPPEPPEPPKEPSGEPDRLSEMLQGLLPDITVGSLLLRELTVHILWVDGDVLVRRATVTHVCLESDLASGSGDLSTNLRLHACDQQPGLLLAVEDRLDRPASRIRELIAGLDIQLATPSPGTLELTMTSDLVRQDLLARDALPGQLLRGRIRVAFRPDERLIRLDVDQFDLLSGGVYSALAAELRDRSDGSVTPHVQTSSGGIDLAPMSGLLEVVLDDGYREHRLEQGTVTYRLTDVALDADSGVVASGELALEARLPEVRLDDGSSALEVATATLAVQGKLAGAGRSELQGAFGVERLLSTAGDSERISLEGASYQLRGTALTLDVDDPLASRGQWHITGRTAGIDADVDGQETRIRGLRLDSRLQGRELLASTGELPIASASYVDAASGLRSNLEDAVVTWNISDIDPAGRRPARGTANVQLPRAEMRDSYQRIQLSDANAAIDAVVRDFLAFDVKLDMPLSRLDIATSDGVTVRARSARLSLDAKEVAVADDPLQSTARVALDSRFGRLLVDLDGLQASARRFGVSGTTQLTGGDAINLSGTVPIGWLQVRESGAARPLAEVARGRLRYRVGDFVLAGDPLASRGRLRVSGALPELVMPGEKEAKDVSLDISSLRADVALGGRRRQHRADLDLRLAGYSRGGEKQPADIAATVLAQADLRTPRYFSKVTVNGPEGPDIAAQVKADYRQKKRELDYEVSLLAERLALIGRILPASVTDEHKVDWRALRIDSESHGRLAEVVRRFRDGLEPVLVSAPLAVARGEQRLSLDVEGLDYRGPGQALSTPKLSVRAHATQAAGPVQVEASVDGRRIGLTYDGDAFEVNGLRQQLNLTSSGPPERGRIDLVSTARIASARQELIGYPIEDATLELEGYIDRLSSLQIDTFRLENPGGGTVVRARLAMERLLAGSFGNAAVVPGRRAMTLSGSWKQELAPVVLDPEAPRMKGKVTVPFRIESGDLSAFLVAVQARLEQVHVAMPDQDLKVSGFSGDIPLIADLAIMSDGSVRLLDGPPTNVYSRTRFLDVHPFLKDNHHLAIDELVYAGERLGPIAGNLRLERDTMALDQLQMGYRRGTVSGQLMVDYRGGRPRVTFRGNMTGIRPSKGKDRLDANAAVSFVPAKLALEGRVQIVRLGRGHLLEILDILDPYREDVDFNRIRLALKAGYPKSVELRMQDGFLSMAIELGGVSRLVRLGRIRGIALEPLLELYLVPYLPEGVVP